MKAEGQSWLRKAERRCRLGRLGHPIALTGAAGLVTYAAWRSPDIVPWFMCAFMWIFALQAWYLYARTRKDLYADNTIHEIMCTTGYLVSTASTFTLLAISVVYLAVREGADLLLVLLSIGASLVAGWCWYALIQSRNTEGR